MYKTLRNIHLFAGLFAVLPLLIYGYSSIRMSHRTWLSNTPQVAESEVSIPAAAGENARAVAQELMDKHGFRGEVRGGRATLAGFQFRLVRPGVVADVNYRKESSTAKITTRNANFTGLMVALHETAGFWHDLASLQVWGVVVLIVSAGLIVLSISGIYMWFKIHEERITGTILLTASLGYSLTVMVMLRMAP